MAESAAAQFLRCGEVVVSPGARFTLIAELLVRIREQRNRLIMARMRHHDVVENLDHPAEVPFLEVSAGAGNDGVGTAMYSR